MISIKNNFLFIHVPKTGGNSIQLVLEKYSDDKIIYSSENTETFEIKNEKYLTTKHSPLSFYKSILDPNIYKSLYKFCAIRNPWEMVISYYFYFTWNWKDFHTPSVEGGTWDENLFLHVLNTYIQPLRHFICTDNKKLTEEMNRIMRFENLENEFLYVLDELEIKRENLLIKNKTKHNDYKEYYNNKLKDIIYEKFKEEIEFFKFEF